MPSPRRRRAFRSWWLGEGWSTHSRTHPLFDIDFPNHYYRRLKAVSVTIPCVSGPNTSLHGTLGLTRSRVRTKDTVAGTGYADEVNYEHQRWTEEIALSAGRDDSGLFQFDFRDAKYLPFEHRGAISSWRLALSGAAAGRPQFDWSSITDVVMTVRYTARKASGLAGAPEAAIATGLQQLQDGGEPMQTMLSFRRDAPDAWRAFRMQDTPDTVPRTLDLDFDWDRLPYVSKALGAAVHHVTVVFVPGNNGLTTPMNSLDARAGLGETYSADFDMPQAPPAGFLDAQVVRFVGLSGSAAVAPGSGKRLTIEVTAGLSAILDADNRVDTNALSDIVVVLSLFPSPATP